MPPVAEQRASSSAVNWDMSTKENVRLRIAASFVICCALIHVTAMCARYEVGLVWGWVGER